MRDYRPLLVALYPPVVLFANLAFMAVLVVRLAPGLGRTSLGRAFTLPGMWSVPVVPVIFLAAMIIGDVVTRWITAQPPLYLPQDAAIRQRADDHLRRWVIGRLYSLFWLVVFIATQGQFFLLDSGGFGQNPLMITDLDGWFLVYFVAMLMGGLVFASLVLSPARPTTGQTGNGVPGRLHAAESPASQTKRSRRRGATAIRCLRQQVWIADNSAVSASHPPNYQPITPSACRHER